mmetsp:Transcript_2060/g.4562  ORF Transcript_2060/g.4562 Transcript_2060/m.4562 type:complete len:987 (-) Transcript_2060:719-3679(-)
MFHACAAQPAPSEQVTEPIRHNFRPNKRTNVESRQKNEYIRNTRERADIPDVDLNKEPQEVWTTLMQHHNASLKKSSTRYSSWESFRLDIMSGSIASAPIIMALYNEQDDICCVTGGPIENTNRGAKRTNPGTRPSRIPKEQQQQYEVRYCDTVVHKNHMHFYEQAGYGMESHSPCPSSHPMHHKLTTLLAAEAGDMVIVRWLPKAEPTQLLSETYKEKWTELLHVYERDNQGMASNHTATHLPTPAPLDAGCTNQQKQGTWEPSTAMNDTTTRLLHTHITFDPQPTNPDRDILATGRYHIQCGMRIGETITNTEIASTHNPEGKCIGTLTAARLAVLRAQFDYTKAQFPDLHVELHAGSFEEEVAKLQHRYKEGYSSGHHTTHLDSHQTTPDPIFRCLVDHLGVTQERFASPLNYNPATQVYWSMYKEDQLFGARWDAYSEPWTGVSQANPEYTAQGMEKSVRHAISSSMLCKDDATVTIFVLPDWKGTPYNKWMGHDTVVRLDVIPRTQFRFKTPCHWQGGPCYAGHPKWDICVFAVCNQKGKEHLLQHQAAFTQAYYQAHMDMNGRGRRPLWAGISASDSPGRSMTEQPTFKHPRKLLTMVQANPSPAQQPLGAALGSATTMLASAQPDNALPGAYMQPHALRWAADTAVYTDGSCTKTTEGSQTLGAAVYFARTGHTLRVDPNGLGATNTITRAELSAILHALKETTAWGELTIFTDSLCSLYIIRKHLHRPEMYRLYKHLPQLREIRQLLIDRALQGRLTRIVKVKAHAGITGNEKADQEAVKASTRRAPVHCTDTTANNHLSTLTWPGKLADPSQTTPHYANNLKNGITDMIRQSTHTGYSNITLYTELWDKAMPDVNRKASSSAWSCAAINFKQLRTSFKAKWGLLYNAKLAQRFQKKTTRRDSAPPCPICKAGPDSSTHMLNACTHPHIASLRIKRHNEAVQLIAKYIGKGDKGHFTGSCKSCSRCCHSCTYSACMWH